MKSHISNFHRPRRSFLKSLALLLIAGAAGYASRRWPHLLPIPVRKRTGDALWASAMFALAILVRPRWSTAKAAAVTLAVAFTIEFSQIYHAPWIDRIRATLFGRLVLGTTFFWLDQVAYIVGVALVVPVDYLSIARRDDGVPKINRGDAQNAERKDESG